MKLGKHGTIDTNINDLCQILNELESWDAKRLIVAATRA